MGYRTMTREDAAIIQQQQIITTGINDGPPTSTTLSNASQQSPISQGHHRTSRFVSRQQFCVYFSFYEF